MTATRNTTTRDRHRRAHKRNTAPCALCGADIDYTLRTPHPMSFEVDHIVPLNRGGSDQLDNTQATHRACNRLKSNRLESELAGTPAPREWITERRWW